MQFYYKKYNKQTQKGLKLYYEAGSISSTSISQLKKIKKNFVLEPNIKLLTPLQPHYLFPISPEQKSENLEIRECFMS